MIYVPIPLDNNPDVLRYLWNATIVSYKGVVAVALYVDKDEGLIEGSNQPSERLRDMAGYMSIRTLDTSRLDRNWTVYEAMAWPETYLRIDGHKYGQHLFGWSIAPVMYTLKEMIDGIREGRAEFGSTLPR